MIHGGDIYTFEALTGQKPLDFSENTNPLGLPSAVQTAITASVNQYSSYPDPNCRTLAQATAQYYNINAAHILFGNGAADLIFKIAYYLNSTPAVVLAPTFSEYELALKNAGSPVEHYHLSSADNFARKALSHIVGRDTKNLDRDGVIKATIETVSENTTDGVVAPLFYMAIGGAPLAFMYKAINTMDSMIGYKNDKYLLFGKCAAKVDDLANFLPARIAALLMIAASAFLSLDPKNAFKIYIRDHKKHASPNSAHTEAACAGALGIQLGGDATYDGVVVHRHTIGNSLRPVQTSDIKRAIQLMYLTSILMLIFSII